MQSAKYMQTVSTILRSLGLQNELNTDAKQTEYFNTWRQPK